HRTIQPEGRVTLRQSLITRNPNVAVYNNGGTVRLLQSTMADNVGFFGAALLNTASGVVSIIQSTFAENLYDTGAIFTYGRLEITASEFKGNGSLEQHFASAIFVAGGSVDVTKTTFVQNAADGSTIFLSAASVVITNMRPR